ncbi:MAG: radical SAM protein [Desulfotomaculaceae bacterium]
MGEIIGRKTFSYTEIFALNGAPEANILPVTSHCNVRCVFCSHFQNPPGVLSYRIAPCTPDEVRQVVCFLDPARPVVIGESATRIIEGEPLTNPAIREILLIVRSSLPRTPIQITTNGSLLDESMVDFLCRLGRVVVNLSLNSAVEKSRAYLMGDAAPARALRNAGLLKSYGLPFHGSIVAMPHLVGWSDLEETIRYLEDCGAETVRLFLPGFTGLAAPVLRFEPSLREELNDFVAGLRHTVDIPLICEPPLIYDLEPVVGGVIKGSPAAAAGIRYGDVIRTVNGVPVQTRVQAFRQVLKADSPEIIVAREEGLVSLRVKKEPLERSGLVMDYDLDPVLITDMVRALRRHGVSRALALTSELGNSVINTGLNRFLKGEVEIEALVVKSRFFGGSIGAAGLLTVADFAAALAEYLSDKPGRRPPLALLPGLAFDRRGKDLNGRSFVDLKQRFGMSFEVL